MIALTEIQLTINDGPVTRVLVMAVLLIAIAFAISLVLKQVNRR